MFFVNTGSGTPWEKSESPLSASKTRKIGVCLGKM